MISTRDRSVRPSAPVAVKISGVVTIANLEQATLHPRMMWGFVPTIEVTAGRSVFVTVVSLSTLAMAGVTAARLLWPAIRGGADRDVLWGRLIGVVVAGETAMLELVRHVRETAVVRSDLQTLTWALVGAGIGLFAVARHRGIAPAVLVAAAAREAIEVSKEAVSGAAAAATLVAATPTPASTTGVGVSLASMATQGTERATVARPQRFPRRYLLPPDPFDPATVDDDAFDFAAALPDTTDRLAPEEEWDDAPQERASRRD